MGYELEMRRGAGGAWSQRRTILGRGLTRTVYADLENGIGYQVRVRAVNLEGDCSWSPPVSGTPTDGLAPKDVSDLIDRVETRPIGSPNRNWRFLTPGRCRYAGSGVVLDANCRYENTGVDTGRIFLVFDDPSRGSCEVTLAYSSLTAGSFTTSVSKRGSTPAQHSIPVQGCRARCRRPATRFRWLPYCKRIQRVGARQERLHTGFDVRVNLSLLRHRRHRCRPGLGQPARI